MQALNILLGLAILLAGRKLFWLFVAIAGFLAGMVVAEEALAGQPTIVMVLAAVLAGIVGAVVAVMFQWAAFVLAGFLGGAYLAMAVAQAAGLAQGQHIAWLVGGIVGGILAFALTDWAIIILSSLVGASAIIEAIPATPMVEALIFVVLVAIGIAVQSRQLTPAPMPPPAAP